MLSITSDQNLHLLVPPLLLHHISHSLFKYLLRLSLAILFNNCIHTIPVPGTLHLLYF